MIYVIRCGRDYICKGSYVVQGEKYKVIGSIEEARKFKTEDAAQREAERLNNSYKYENISDTTRNCNLGLCKITSNLRFNFYDRR